MYQQYAPYGALPANIMMSGKGMSAKLGKETTKARPGFAALLGCIFVPCLIFVTTFWLRSFEIRRDSQDLANFLCHCLLLPILAFAWMTFNLTRSGDPRAMAFLTISCLASWIAGYIVGGCNYTSYMRPYYDINNLNVYPSVDPSNHTGNQYMDAGMIEFTKGSSLWLQKSVGFKNDDVYCVAPIVGKGNTTSADFWAVGLNCCSGHKPDFHCGEYSNPHAHWGLRLMDDRKRDMFRLAVMEASQTFHIKASHPIFVYWLSDPTSEVSAYQEDGFKFFMLWMFGNFCVQLSLVVCGLLCHAKW
jgi:hypothetical protein